MGSACDRNRKHLLEDCILEIRPTTKVCMHTDNMITHPNLDKVPDVMTHGIAHSLAVVPFQENSLPTEKLEEKAEVTLDTFNREESTDERLAEMLEMFSFSLWKQGRKHDGFENVHDAGKGRIHDLMNEYILSGEVC